MIKITLSFLLLFFFINTVSAQDINACGTPAIKSAWLNAYQQRTPVAFKQEDSTLYVPMTIHNVGEDDDSGYFDVLKVLDAFCTLNEDFKAANIRFYLTADINKINNSALNQHDSLYDAGMWMQQYDIDNTVNSYLVKNPADNCGYNLPWASLAVNKSCACDDCHTWAHEVGHHFTLPHPFFGWEGGISYKDTVPPNYREAAPETVLVNYTNFKEMAYRDTLIIDTILVEKLDGSNCHEAADGFCDTPPDYLSIRWACDNNEQSPTVQTDPNGEKFRSDGTLIMSYADDGCANRFTPQQIAAMRAYLMEERPDLFTNPIVDAPLITSVPSLNYPIANESVSANAIELSWNPVEHATRYIVQVDILPSFPGSIDKMETDQTSINITDLQIGRKYYWRVRPYSFFDTCASASDTESFVVSEELTSTSTIDGLNKFEVYPSILTRGMPFKILLDTDHPIKGVINIRSISGKEIFTQKITLLNGESDIEINSIDLPNGLYFIGLETSEGHALQKLLLQ